jgi:hypothetical protein
VWISIAASQTQTLLSSLSALKIPASFEKHSFFVSTLSLRLNSKTLLSHPRTPADRGEPSPALPRTSSSESSEAAVNVSARDRLRQDESCLQAPSGGTPFSGATFLSASPRCLALALRAVRHHQARTANASLTPLLLSPPLSLLGHPISLSDCHSADLSKGKRPSFVCDDDALPPHFRFRRNES